MNYLSLSFDGWIINIHFPIWGDDVAFFVNVIGPDHRLEHHRAYLR